MRSVTELSRVTRSRVACKQQIVCGGGIRSSDIATDYKQMILSDRVCVPSSAANDYSAKLYVQSRKRALLLIESGFHI